MNNAGGTETELKLPRFVATHALGGEERPRCRRRDRRTRRSSGSRWSIGFGRGRTPEDLARELEPSSQAIRTWVAQADRDVGGRRDGLRTEEREEASPAAPRGPAAARRARDIRQRQRPVRAGDPTRKVYGSMSANQARFGVAAMARVLGVSPSGYYAWRRRPPSARTQADADLEARAQSIHRRSRGTYGASRIHAELTAGGTVVSRNGGELLRDAGGRAAGRRRGPRCPSVPSRC